MINFLHLCPQELSLNGESGNLAVLQQRLSWAGFDSEVYSFEGNELPAVDFDLVFIGSGSASGSLAALELLKPIRQRLAAISNEGSIFFALGLGWEILGQSITDSTGVTIEGLGLYPSRSRKTDRRASEECFGFFEGELTTGYANHGSDIELIAGDPLIRLEKGFGNYSSQAAPGQSGEGLRKDNLWAARLNGPILAINPHLADSLLEAVCARKGLSYSKNLASSNRADEYAKHAREELKNRLV